MVLSLDVAAAASAWCAWVAVMPNGREQRGEG